MTLNQPAHGKDEYDAEGGITKATIREIFRNSNIQIGRNLDLLCQELIKKRGVPKKNTEVFKKRFFIKLPAISHDKNKLASLPGTRALWNFRSLEEHRMLYRKLFCDCKHCLLMKLENVSKCENQDVVGPPSEWKLHISRQLENPVFEENESEVSDQFDDADAVELNPRVKTPKTKEKTIDTH